MNGEFLGVAGGFGYLVGNGEIDMFMIIKTTGIAEEKLMDLSDYIPVMIPKEIISHIEFIQEVIEKILKEYENRL